MYAYNVYNMYNIIIHNNMYNKIILYSNILYNNYGW